MMFDAASLAVRYPVLFHTTTCVNAEHIERARRLTCAHVLMSRAGWALADPRRRSRRRVLEALNLDAGLVTLMDQRPLHVGHIEFEDGWDLDRLIDRLNELVFFWPGDRNGPIATGRNHLAKYVGRDCITLCVNTAELLALNKANPPLFAAVNSGAPRSSAGKKARRGASTFQDAPAFTLGRLREVVFEREVILPAIARWPP